jgi:exodeoxyribonuclease V alpha subunit
VAEQYPFLREIFPGASPELLRLLQGGVENALLLRNDFYTMRDWLDIADDADLEPLHAILLLMLVALEEGSLCIDASPSALSRRLQDLVSQDDVSLWARRIGEAIDRHAFSRVVGNTVDDHKPVVLHDSGTGRFLYFQKYLHAELAFRQELSERLSTRPPRAEVAWPQLIGEVLRDQAFRPDADQATALATALGNNLTIISGGPGTGKTSIVLTLLRCLTRGGIAPSRIALAAPTGRAAQRLTDALRSGLQSSDDALRDMTATTLHQLLAYRPSRNQFARHRENPIPADVVIIDEVSMIGLVLMAQLFQAVEPGARLVLLGDKDQLPSVDAGAVLAHLAPDGGTSGPLRERVVLLRTNHRSQAEIRTAAEAINRQDAGIVDRLPACPIDFANIVGCYFLEQKQKTSAELRGFLQSWIEQAYFRSKLEGQSLAEMLDATEIGASESVATRLLQLLDRYRLLTLVRDGSWGCDEINHYMEILIRPRLDAGSRSGLFVGAPVLITRNDAARGLYNGDVGITLRQRGGGLRVLFARQAGCISFPAEALPAHELAFALTVHKSQGSEYDNVMVVLPPTGARRLLTKELLYTAVTRAKSLAVICGARDVVQAAIGRRIVRESGLLGSRSQTPFGNARLETPFPEASNRG